MSVTHVTKDNFKTEVLDAGCTVLVDFWAVWCGPCRMIAPILEQVAEERPDVKVCKIDVDQEMELAMQFQVSSIPTLIVVKNGEVVNRSVGIIPKEKLLELL